jgi:hypothetical protein
MHRVQGQKLVYFAKSTTDSCTERSTSGWVFQRPQQHCLLITSQPDRLTSFYPSSSSPSWPSSPLRDFSPSYYHLSTTPSPHYTFGWEDKSTSEEWWVVGAMMVTRLTGAVMAIEPRMTAVMIPGCFLLWPAATVAGYRFLLQRALTAPNAAARRTLTYRITPS